jgi:hypothetical protein
MVPSSLGRSWSPSGTGGTVTQCHISEDTKSSKNVCVCVCVCVCVFVCLYVCVYVCVHVILGLLNLVTADSVQCSVGK